jgi:hypothetical protein
MGRGRNHKVKTNQAWHFVGKTLRDGSPIPRNDKWLEIKGPLKICERGLHASRNPFDALQFSPGETLCLVEIAGVTEEHADKLVCHKRKIIARMDATELLQYFANQCALSTIDRWEAPDVVLDFLMTNDRSLRPAAMDAARAAARAAAWAAARDAAWDAARAAARAAAWAAARDAARDAAWDAARDAARAAAWAAARDAARDAAWDAARDAAMDAAMDARKNEFTQLVYECFEDFI